MEDQRSHSAFDGDIAYASQVSVLFLLARFFALFLDPQFHCFGFIRGERRHQSLYECLPCVLGHRVAVDIIKCRAEGGVQQVFYSDPLQDHAIGSV